MTTWYTLNWIKLPMLVWESYDKSKSCIKLCENVKVYIDTYIHMHIHMHMNCNRWDYVCNTTEIMLYVDSVGLLIGLCFF